MRHEALFYVAFGILICSRKVGNIVFALWSAGVLVQMVLGLTGMSVDGVSAFLLSSYQFDFIIGGAAALLHRRVAFHRSFLPLCLSLIGLASVFWIQEHFGISRTGTLDYTSIPALFWTPVLGLAFASVMYGLLCIEKSVKVPNSLVLLGAASYSIYLVHTPVNLIAQRIAQFFPTAILAVGSAHIFFVTIGVALGIALHLYVEKPVARQLRSALLPRNTSETTASGTHEDRPDSLP